MHQHGLARRHCIFYQTLLRVDYFIYFFAVGVGLAVLEIYVVSCCKFLTVLYPLNKTCATAIGASRRDKRALAWTVALAEGVTGSSGKSGSVFGTFLVETMSLKNSDDILGFRGLSGSVKSTWKRPNLCLRVKGR